jgi:hypothetical protein
MKRNVILWASILAGPLVWLISFQANFALVPWACIFQGKVALYLVSLLALAACAVSGLVAWREWRSLGRELNFDGSGALPRSRMMAFSGVVLSTGFFLVVLAQAIPEVILRECQ